jgi:protein-S-isoprenylcysteine O-methyltransferase Ste14
MMTDMSLITHVMAVGQPGAILFLVGSAAFLAILLVSRLTAGGGEQGAARSRRSIVGIAIQMAAFLPFAAFPVRLTLPATSIAALLGAGIQLLLMGSAVALFAWARRTMGRNWSLVARTRDDHRLVTGGPFAIVRHPIYLALLLFLLAEAMAAGRPGMLVIVLPVYGLGTAIRVREEEWLLRAHFGAEYEAYAARVSRIVPGLL